MTDLIKTLKEAKERYSLNEPIISFCGYKIIVKGEITINYKYNQIVCDTTPLWFNGRWAEKL